uniref:Protein kinase domain-containing protein n=1 Tax=Oryza rufipogon TaxID=4529 RepID=A0A0E0Q8I7_ORYRU
MTSSEKYSMHFIGFAHYKVQTNNKYSALNNAPSSRIFRHKYNHIFCVTDMGDWYDKLSQSFRDTAKEVLAKTDIDPNVRCFPKRQMKRITNNYSTTLGRGGFSVVYKGRLDDGRSVAVKQYNWRTQKEFTKEVIIQSQCSHKNIVRLLGCCVEAAAPILVTEFVPNGNLSDLLHGNSGLLPVTLETRLQIALDVAEALVYMHCSQSYPILHGDVKPSNILLGDKGVAKLCDFGISRLLSMDSDEYTGFVIGSKEIFACDLRLKIAIGAAEGIAHLHSLGVVHGDVSINDILLDHVSSSLVKIAGYGTSGLPDIDKALDSLETGHGKKEHDVYSFGLVLLTLFTWKKVSLPHDLKSEPDKPVLLHQEAIRGRRCNHLEMIKGLASRCLTSEATK